MNIFEKLNETEQDMIANYIEAYASYDGDNSVTLKAPLSHILRFWNENKVDLFKIFGGELILTKKVSITRPIQYLEEDISNMLRKDGETFLNAFNRWSAQQNSDIRWELPCLLYSYNLANNIWHESSFVVPTPDGHQIAVNTGCKISKVLGKIANAFNIPGYEEFRIAHSQCLNQKKLNGELCVSIHPLDYMTMSDNECDWSSCMSWADHGDYRQGTVEMMNSPCVVVAYLKSAEDMHMPYCGTWSNKKWRQLFIVTPHIITGIRQYPYQSDELNGITLQWLRELVMLNSSWGPFEDTVTIVRNHADVTVAGMDRVIYLDFSTHFMYNDFYAQHPSYLSPTIPDRYDLCFSGETECMLCGENISYYDACDGCTSSLTCNSCEHIIWCAECGERINEDDAIEVDGSYVCQYCYENNYHECHCCENTYHESDIRPIYLMAKAEPTNYFIWVCRKCFESDSFTKTYGPTTVIAGRWDGRTYVDLDNLTLDALDQFDIWHYPDYEEYKSYLEAKAKE